MKEKTNFLKQVVIFTDLSDSEMNSAAEMFKEHRYKRSEIIFVEEDTGNYMYVIKEGRVKVSRILPNGKETILTFHQAGEYFGEMSLIDGETAPATVTAVVATTIFFITRHDFSILLEIPQVHRALLQMLCKRCREAWAQVSVLAFHHADARIRAALYHLCQKRGVETDRGTRIARPSRPPSIKTSPSTNFSVSRSQGVSSSSSGSKGGRAAAGRVIDQLPPSVAISHRRNKPIGE